jgi:hypothetical protein
MPKPTNQRPQVWRCQRCGFCRLYSDGPAPLRLLRPVIIKCPSPKCKQLRPHLYSHQGRGR